MAGVLYPLSRALLFRLEPETAHSLSLATIARVGRVPGLRAVVASRFSMPHTWNGADQDPGARRR